jgi:hypothetical protein
MLMTKCVPDKQTFYQLSQQLTFGNRLKQFSYSEYLNLMPDQRPPLTSVRSRSAVASSPIQRYRLSPSRTLAHCKRLLTTGIQPDDFYLDESAPDTRVTLQAEVMNSERFVDMRYALHTGIGMRAAYLLPSGFPYRWGVSPPPNNRKMYHTWGVPAINILRRYLDAASWDNLCMLLQEYRDSIIELSAYDCSVGVLGWNTLFWDVRNF